MGELVHLPWLFPKRRPVAVDLRSYGGCAPREDDGEGHPTGWPHRLPSHRSRKISDRDKHGREGGCLGRGAIWIDTVRPPKPVGEGEARAPPMELVGCSLVGDKDKKIRIRLGEYTSLRDRSREKQPDHT